MYIWTKNEMIEFLNLYYYYCGENYNMEIMSLWFPGDIVFIFDVLWCVPLQQVLSTINKNENSLLLNDIWHVETANIIVSIH